MTDFARTVEYIRYVEPDTLLAHPLNARVYGEETLERDFVDSIRVNGVQEPVIVTHTTNDGLCILSGHRRVAAAERVGRKVPIRIIPAESDSELWQECFLLESNRQRIKTPEQKAREFTELKRIEAAFAKERQQAALKQGTREGKVATTGKGKARDKAAAKVGLKPRTVEKLEKVVRAADAGNLVARKALDDVNAGKKSVNAAAQAIRPVAATATPREVPRGSLPECKYVETLLTKDEANRFLAELSDLPWKQHIIPMYGKKIPAPRLFQWMGIPPQPKSYTGGTPIEGGLYGQKIAPIDWTPAALAIKARVEEATGEKFDSLNLNLYRDDKDHIGWHVDKEDEGLWTAPIASVSLGAVRTFQIREFKIVDGHRRKKEKVGDIYSLPLAHGSLVVMPAGFQARWLHRLAPTSESCEARINLTFRRMSKAVETPREAPRESAPKCSHPDFKRVCTSCGVEL